MQPLKLQVNRRVGIALGWLLLVSVPGIAVNEPASAATIPTSALARVYEPVVVRGEQLPLFANTPTSQLFAYAYQGGVWHQIPAQVDEISAAGRYTEAETPAVLDANDEVVFMVKDVGEAANGAVPSVGGQPLSAWWYELQIHDPTSAAATGWVYLLRSATVTRTFEDGYIQFDPTSHRLHGMTYELGFATPKQWVNYLALGGSNIDILDRMPRSKLCLLPRCRAPITEDRLPEMAGDGLIKNGPVRVILRDGRMRAYGWTLEWSLTFESVAVAASLQYSTDFNAAATGATYYNAATGPTGVPVDGKDDESPRRQPLSRWWQLSTSNGTLVFTSSYTSIGGTFANYYLDDATASDGGTSDPGHYANTGIIVTNPEKSFTYDVELYLLPENQQMVGDDYLRYSSLPLTTIVQRQNNLQHAYLPAITR